MAGMVLKGQKAIRQPAGGFLFSFVVRNGMMLKSEVKD
jgi:hypothetical protein